MNTTQINYIWLIKVLVLEFSRQCKIYHMQKIYLINSTSVENSCWYGLDPPYFPMLF